MFITGFFLSKTPLEHSGCSVKRRGRTLYLIVNGLSIKDPLCINVVSPKCGARVLFEKNVAIQICGIDTAA